MKKISSLIMTLTLCTFVLTACGISNDQPQSSANVQDQLAVESSTSNSESLENEEESVAGDTQEASDNSTEQQNEDNTDEPTGKVLVVYYSATGNTKGVAEVIADYTNGDTFELIPVDDYSDSSGWVRQLERKRWKDFDCLFYRSRKQRCGCCFVCQLFCSEWDSRSTCWGNSRYDSGTGTGCCGD